MKLLVAAVGCVLLMEVTVPGLIAGTRVLTTFDSNRRSEEAFVRHLLVGHDGTWSGSFVGDRYLLSNTVDSNSISYFYISGISVGDRKLSLESVAASVDVQVSPLVGRSPDSGSGAGLYYSLDPQGDTYAALVLRADGSYGLYVYDGNKFGFILGGTQHSIRPGAVNRLTLDSSPGEGLKVIINGEHLSTFDRPGARAGRIGILAFGLGNFYFDNFDLHVKPDTPAREEQPPDAPRVIRPF